MSGFWSSLLPGQRVGSEDFNWFKTCIRNGGPHEVINLPTDYDEGVFPRNDKVQLVKSSDIGLSGNFINNNTSLIFNRNDTVIFNVYPNLSDFKHWETVTIRANGENNSFTIKIIAKNGDELFSESIVDSNDEIIDFDLIPANIGVEKVDVKIISESDNLEIKTVKFGYDITPEGLEGIFQDIETEKGFSGDYNDLENKPDIPKEMRVADETTALTTSTENPEFKIFYPAP